jgi:glucokinase
LGIKKKPLLTGNGCFSQTKKMMSPLKKMNLAFPRKPPLSGKGLTILAGDAGGTKTNLALYRATPGNMATLKESTYHSSSYRSIIDIIKQFLAENGNVLPDRICLGVAGPVLNGKVELTNLSWKLDSEELEKETGVGEVFLINDLEATAFGLEALGEEDYVIIHEGGAEAGGNMAIIAPGTGLGEAGLYWDGSVYHPFATEGGHTDFDPRTPLDISLLQYLQKKYGIVSWERVIAGPGIHDIYQFLLPGKIDGEPGWLKKAIEVDDPSAIISQAAVEKTDPLCVETMELYVRYLARESSNLVLKMKATGGLFLGGGIPPKISSLLKDQAFYQNFLDCDRMQNLLKGIPVRVILNNKTALLGAAWYGAFGS